jgi:hypothetical protein
MKANKITKVLTGVAAAMALLGSGSVHAATYQFFDASNTLYATMVTSGGTTFSMTMAGGLNSAAYIDYLNLAGPGGTFSYLSAGVATLSSSSYSAAGFNDAGSTYNWKLDWQNANNAGRFTGGETVSWSIVVTDPNAWNFNLLHVNAFDGTNSIKLSSCVVPDGQTSCDGTPPPGRIPEPGTLALVGAALVAGGLVRRRARQAKA